MKILIIRLSSIGDIVLTTPVVRCLAQQTSHEVHYLTKKQNIQLLENNPNISKLISFDGDIKETIRLLKAEKYDYIIDLHNNFRSSYVKLNLVIQSKSLNKLDFRKWIYTNFKINLMPNKHVVDRNLDAVKHFKIKNDGEGLDFYFSDKTKLPDNILLPEKYITFAVGTQHFTKTVSEEYVIKIINKVNDLFPVVLIGGEKEVEVGKRIASSCKNVLNCVGKMDLQQSALLIQKSELLFSGDTGMMHIAAALKKNLISLWASTTPDLGVSPYFPNGYEGLNLLIERNDLKCRPCGKFGREKCPCKHFDCGKYTDDQISEIRTMILQRI